MKVARGSHKAGAIVAAVVLFSIALGACSFGESQDLPVYGDMPSFSLTDQLGRTVTSQDFHGKVLLANFIFTNCTEFCPVLSSRMQSVQEQLKREGLLGQDVVLLSFSVDPEYDTPGRLRAYAESYGADGEAWRFLTGPAESMRQVVTGGFKLAFETIPQEIAHVHEDGSMHVHEHNVTHSNRVVLVDRGGRIRAYYDGAQDWDMDEVLKGVRQVVEERES